MKNFLNLYKKRSSKFRVSPNENKIIIVVDNDSGGKDTICAINSLYKKNIQISDPTIIHKITEKLTLVKTPHVGIKKETTIEDLLPDDVKSVTINGKTFSAEKILDETKNFGKIKLASYVHDNASVIDFTAFNDFLSELDSGFTT
ncbi:hypothetical protein AA0311_0561 [Asaia bogorensis NBRC 16594]|uniref:Uncharacterized protein n=1 Tax=Asaia bogorensis NBRC 16594 TaxID=1231624 RepID=A0AAN4R1S9_9PROT|nr:ribonuclease H [Asaia bogorensis NBRC 16594]GBQ74522.1 hypothetical protein AA0311_0561 [Asaia bogorensis NBRC 16594]GEL52700.1 hypothetical protein ABO01nite_07070 [Asaia bogorensis NBRC 16594]